MEAAREVGGVANVFTLKNQRRKLWLSEKKRLDEWKAVILTWKEE